MGKKSKPKAPAAPDYAAAAQAQGDANTQAARTSAELTNTNQVTPYGTQTFAKDPNSDQWTSTVSLSPDQQRLYDLQTQGDTKLGEMANNQLGRINDSFSKPFDTSSAPSRVSSVNAPNYDLYQGQDNSGRTKEVEDSLYRSATNRLDPQFEQRESAERARLINSGVADDSEAFRNSMGEFNRDRNAAYGDARDRAIQGSGAEDSRLVSQNLATLGFNNSAKGQGLYDQIAAGNFQNQARGAAIDEAAYMRNEPLNAYNALNSGSQVTQPQFRGTGTPQGPAAAPTFAATQASDQRAIDLYNAQLAGSGSAQSGLMGMMGTLGGVAIKEWSDRRLKRDIKRLGTLSTGLPYYSYTIFGKPEVGVMADEVRQIHPDAVSRQPNGYDMVDYSKVLA